MTAILPIGVPIALGAGYVPTSDSSGRYTPQLPTGGIGAWTKITANGTQVYNVGVVAPTDVLADGAPQFLADGDFTYSSPNITFTNITPQIYVRYR